MALEPTVATRPGSGLMAGNAAVPLEGVSVEATVCSLSARVTVRQRYRNREAQPIEAVYTFPLDEGAAVCGFEAAVGGVHYVGKVLERDEAFEAYDKAIEAGHGAYLLDEERPDVFVASVGNVPAGGEVLVSLTYVVDLALEGDAVRFTLPTTISPRYAPAADRAGVGRPDSETLNPPVAWTVPYGLGLRLVLDLPEAITRVESPSHAIAIELEGTRAVVTLATEQVALDRDFVLLAAPFPSGRPVGAVERDEQGRLAASLAFCPSFSSEQAPSEVVFVVDRSGSMAGSSIEQVRNALQLSLRSLIPGCWINIVGFGSTFEALFPESRPYDEASLAAASAHAGALQADLGGTEILQPLAYVLEQPAKSELPRQLVILTDGEVTNTDAVLALVGRHRSTVRVFCFGIGHGASHHLVKGMARAGGGAAEFISPGERIERKVMRQFGRLLSPAVTDLALDWGGIEATQAPHALPPVFAGERLLVHGLLAGDRSGRVTLSGKAGGRRFSEELVLDPASAREGATIGRLAARALIRELEESPEWLTARGSRQARRKDDRVKAEIIRLATAYGVASRETSFVAIERRETPVKDAAVLRRVPIALTHGWGGTDRGAGVLYRVQACAAPLATATVFSLGGPDMGAPEFEASSQRAPAPPRAASPTLPHRVFRRLSPSILRAGPREAAEPPVAARPLDRLVRLQRADGSWELTRDLAELLGVSVPQIESALGAGRSGDERIRTAFATALAIAWLRRHAADTSDEWELLARKANRWLDERAPARADGVPWFEAAAEWLSRV